MNRERWQEIKRIYSSALDLDSGRREEFIQQACGGDASMQEEVESLLARQMNAEEFLNVPAIDVAARVISDQELKSSLVSRTVSHYRVIEKIGEGGMAEVYLADDLSLSRKVAIKLLPHAFAEDPERLARFEREAKLLASLSHPNIATIYGLERTDSSPVLVMELVKGDTLAQRVRKGPLPVDKVLEICHQIAEGLAAAHEQGIIHRDLKPSNIMVNENGLVKILDFGLAKWTHPIQGEASGTKDSSESLTGSGIIVGTVAYMSPEQAEGKPADARSDIFSFGAVLYEMISGRRAFKGDSRISTLAAVLHEEPEPVGWLAGGITVKLDRIITRCLKKDPERRFQHMDEVKVALEELRVDSASGRWSKPIYWVAASTLVILCSGIWAFFRLFPLEGSQPPPRILPVTTFPGLQSHPDFSPDGNWVAFEWNGEKEDNLDIYVKEVDGPGLNRLTTDLAIDTFPRWSPNGRQIAFSRHWGDRYSLCLISPLGGVEKKLTDYNGTLGLSWSPDGKRIAFAARESSTGPFSIWSLSMETLEKERLTRPANDIPGDILPAFSPDSRYLAFLRLEAARPKIFSEPTRSAIYVIRLPRGEPSLVTSHGSPNSACWTADSREIVFPTSWVEGEAALWRIPIEGGKPSRVYARGEYTLWPAISRAGNRLAYADFTYNHGIWRLELTGDKAMEPPSKPLISSSSPEVEPQISPDTNKVAFCSLRSGNREIWVCSSDGTNALKLTDMKAESTGHPSWSPDGKRIAFDSTSHGNSDLFVVDAEGGPVRRITTDATEETVPRWSRDGLWICFGSNRSGRWQVWKMPSEGGKAVQITRNGGMAAIESPDGYLYYSHYYTDKKGVWRVPVSGGPEMLVTDASNTEWDWGERGLYFVDFQWQAQPIIRLFDFAARRVADLAPVADKPGFALLGGMAVSPDNKWLLYSGGTMTAHILIIDPFR